MKDMISVAPKANGARTSTIPQFGIKSRNSKRPAVNGTTQLGTPFQGKAKPEADRNRILRKVVSKLVEDRKDNPGRNRGEKCIEDFF